MRTILLTTVALLTLLMSGCRAQSTGEAPTAIVPAVASQAQTNPPEPPAAQEADAARQTPSPPLAVTATPTVEPVSTTLAGEIATGTGVEAVIYVANIRLRAGPGLSYDQGQMVRADERYEVLGKSSSGVWFQLDTTGEAGWIPARYIMLVGDGELVPVVADDLGLVAPLGMTPVPRVTNTPGMPPSLPPPGVQPPSSGNSGAPLVPTSAQSAPSTPPTLISQPTGAFTPIAPPSAPPTPTSTPTSLPIVPTDTFTPIAPTAVP